MTNVVIPVLGEGIQKAVVSYWFVKTGATVNAKDDLVELSTDKATFNLPSPCSGVLVDIIAGEGRTVLVGEPVAIIDEAAAERSSQT